MYVAWLQMSVGIVILLAGVAAVVLAWRRIAAYKAAGHGGGAWSALRVLGVVLVLLAAPIMLLATSLGGAHIALDEDTIDDLGSSYFNEHYYAHGQISKDGFDDWQRFVKPDYDHAKSTVDGRGSGTYCIKVTRQFGGQYGEDGHSDAAGYQPTDVEKKTICIPIVWNSDLEDFEATESDADE